MNTSTILHEAESTMPTILPPSIMAVVALFSILYMGGAAHTVRKKKGVLEERMEALEEELRAREFHAHVLKNDIKSYEMMFRERGEGGGAADMPAPGIGPLDQAIMDALGERKWQTTKEILEIVSRSAMTNKKIVNSRLYSLKARGRISFKEGSVPKWRK